MGKSGKEVSESFRGNNVAFGFPDWPEFHVCWTAVRTAFIDNWLKEGCERIGDGVQIVNLGAGVCSRGYRL